MTVTVNTKSSIQLQNQFVNIKLRGYVVTQNFSSFII